MPAPAEADRELRHRCRSHRPRAAARERGILVTNTPGVLTEDTADMNDGPDPGGAAPALRGRATAARRRLAGLGADHHARPTASGASGSASSVWGGSARLSRAQGAGLSGSPSTIQPQPAGRGDRGRARGDLVAEPGPDAGAHGFRLDSLPEHARATYHLLSARRLGLLRPQAYVINTSRGPRDRRGGRWCACSTRAGSPAAGLDVYENEPRGHAKLLTLDNVVALPHIGSATIEGASTWARRC